MISCTAGKVLVGSKHAGDRGGGHQLGGMLAGNRHTHICVVCSCQGKERSSSKEGQRQQKERDVEGVRKTG